MGFAYSPFSFMTHIHQLDRLFQMHNRKSAVKEQRTSTVSSDPVSYLQQGACVIFHPSFSYSHRGEGSLSPSLFPCLSYGGNGLGRLSKQIDKSSVLCGATYAVSVEDKIHSGQRRLHDWFQTETMS